MAATVAIGFIATSCGSDDNEADSTTAAPVETTAEHHGRDHRRDDRRDHRRDHRRDSTAETTAETTDETTAETTGESTAPAEAADLSALEDECATEGNKVNLIALPDEWANYKGILARFGEKYPDVDNPVANPDASSQGRGGCRQDAGRSGRHARQRRRQPGHRRSRWSTRACSSRTRRRSIADDPRRSARIRTTTGRRPTTASWRSSTNTTIVPERAEDVRRPEEAGVRGPGRAQRRPSRGGRRVRRGHGRSLANGGSADDIMPGIEFFAELKESGNLGGADVTPATRAVRRDADRHRLELQRARPAAAARGGRPHRRDELPDRRRVRRLLRPGRRQGLAAPGLRASCGSSTSSPTRARSATSRAARCRPATSQLVDAGLVTEELKANLPPDELISPDRVPHARPRSPRPRRCSAENWGPMVADA